MTRVNEDGEHFWIATYPFVDTSLIITPPENIPSAEEEDVWSSIKIFDCDGELVNSVDLRFAPKEVGSISLDPLMGACKLESGFKAAHVVAKALKPAVRHQCRVISQDHAWLSGPTFLVYPTQMTFFPVSFTPLRQNYVSAVNLSDEEGALRVRLYFGSRTPEVLITIPPRGARIICVEHEFSECMEKVGDKTLQGYLRFSTKIEKGIGVQLLEKTEGPKEMSFYYSVA